MSQQIHIQLKTMSGDLFPLEVDPSASLEAIAQRASVAHPDTFPLGRTKVLSIDEDRKECQEGEMLLAIVADPPRVEEGVYPQGGQPYIRWNISLRGETYYLYIAKWWRSPLTDVIHPQYAIGLTETVTKPSENHGAPQINLWEIVRTYVPNVTPKEMKDLRTMMEPYLLQKATENDWVVTPFISKDEPMECGCGSTVKYSGLKAHEKTKKHQSWMA